MSDKTHSGRTDWVAIVTRLRIPLIVIALVIIGVIIASVAVFQIIETRSETATRAVEQLEEQVQELLLDLGAEEPAASERFERSDLDAIGRIRRHVRRAAWSLAAGVALLRNGRLYRRP